MLATFLLTAACTSSAPPAPPPAPSRSVVTISDGAIVYNGQLLDARLAERDERYIPALSAVLPDDAEPLYVVSGPGVTWRPVRRVLLTADARGVSELWLRWQDGPERGPLGLPRPAADAPPPGPPSPVGLLKIHQRAGQAWLTAQLRFSGARPQDCAAAFSEPAHRGACDQGGAQAAYSLGRLGGCLVPTLPPQEAIARWPAELAPQLDALGAGAAWSWVVLIDTSVDMGVVDGVLGALGETKPARISLGGATETRTAPAPCSPDLVDADGIALAGARWVGSALDDAERPVPR